MTRFRAAWTTHGATGCAVTPSTRIRRPWCSITPRTNTRTLDKVTVSKKPQATRASAWERGKLAQVAAERLGAESDPGLLQDLHHLRGDE